MVGGVVIASSSGLAIMGGVIVAALGLLWVLLRAEARDAQEDPAREELDGETAERERASGVR
jgi:hypothetical protein